VSPVDSHAGDVARGYRRLVRLVPTGRATELREKYDTKRCESCGGLLASPHVLISHQPCSCVVGGHRTLRCLGCDTLHHEPPCTHPERGIGSAYG
jgi:hypothetical protein